RRHTRFSRDWSSDVCSSDLTLLIGAPAIPDASATPIRPDYSGSDLWLHYPKIEDPALKKRYAKSATAVIVQNAGKNPVHRHTRRSEERRVGKECKTRRQRYG